LGAICKGIREFYRREEETSKGKGKDHCGCQCHYDGEQEEKERNIINNSKQNDHKGIITSRRGC
jgi:hypothetical protein